MPRYDILRFLPQGGGSRLAELSDPILGVITIVLLSLTVFILRSRQRPHTLLSFVLVSWLLVLSQLLPPAAVNRVSPGAVQVIYRIWDMTLPFSLILLFLSISTVLESSIRRMSRPSVLASWGTAFLTVLWWAMMVGVQYFSEVD